jgi:TPR repeat protein
LYAKGQGVPQDYVLAHMWFNLSATQGNQVAKSDRDKAARFMTMAQIVKAQRLAREWKPTTQPPR